MAERTQTLEFEGITFTVSTRRVKYSRLEFRSPTPVLVVPYGVKPQKVLEENRKWIKEKYRRQVEKSMEAADLPLERRSEREIEDLVHYYVEGYSRELKVQASEVKFRKMKRRWGTCRSNGVIILNRCLRYLPRRLVAYIVFHELLHLLIRGHNKNFKAMIADRFPDFRDMERGLDLYGIRLLSPPARH